MIVVNKRKSIYYSFTLFFLLFHSITAISLEPVNPKLSPTARGVLNYFESIYGQATLSGYNIYPHTPDDYEQTGMQAAVWGDEMSWLRRPAALIEKSKRYGYILTLHWHWSFDNDSAWTGKRKKQVDVGRMVTPGTPEHIQTMKELSVVADKLQQFEDADIPILWRPLHEIDGGWFWWTDVKNPKNTAKLWRMMYDYFTNERDLNNLIWVYSAGEGNKTVKDRKRYYPGANYVDISGIDIYGVNPRNDIKKYWDYFRTMQKVSPGKMLACGEADAIPDPDKMSKGELPKWLYVLPWWGTPARGRPVDWAQFTMRHNFVVSLDELPKFSSENIAPQVGILEPRDNGATWFVKQPPTIQAYATDRDGQVKHVTFLANGKPIGIIDTPPFNFTWKNAPNGSYDLTVEAEDNSGSITESNNIRVNIGLRDLARGKSVKASSGKKPELAVDGNVLTAWGSGKSDKEWFYVDLGATHQIDRVNLLWGWKIHPMAFTIDLATTFPHKTESWKTVYTENNRSYKTWKATDRIRFELSKARYVRVSASKRAGGQNWGGYNLTAFEVPAK